MASHELASRFHASGKYAETEGSYCKWLFARCDASCYASELVDQSARRGVGAIFQIMPLGPCEV